ncbi:protein kinase domain-containing protein [Laspinema olomoucense]|uniref:WD40 domain-containing protein n=1 Tax=Laspinema olomoucense TaxID=3231600 RepID=UPI0021BB81B6|nr:protein kinase [Laspinema sp. D3a]MCT7989947.1 protein kinase [Laspinema sp. D3a]
MRCLNCHAEGISSTNQYCPKCGAHLPALQQNLLPEQTRLKADTYEIEYALGRGGFGITYRAHHIGLEQPVAIKEYYPQELAHRHSNNGGLTVPQNKTEMYQRWLTRFLREGRILAKLNHPSLVRVQDLFEERNTAYLVMELLSGKTLGQELDEQPGKKLDPQRVREIITALVSALAATHQAGVYHLDLKPDNILLTPEGRIVLIDFGAAKQESAAIGPTRSTRAFTPDYAPPELIGNQAIGPESDIFELGMLLHQMLTGTLPPPALSRLMGEPWEPQLEEPWQTLVASALPLQKNQRPNNISEWWKTAASKVNSSGNMSSAKPSVPNPVINPPPKSESVAGKGAVALRGYFVLPELQKQGMVRRFGRGTIQNVLLLNQELAIVCATGGAALFNLSSGEALWEIDCPADSGAVSQDGKLLALGWNEAIYLWDLTTGQFLRQVHGHTNRVNSLALSPDGKFLASGSWDKTVRRWNTATGSELNRFSGQTTAVNSVALSPDGKFLASGSTDSVRLWNAATGQELFKVSRNTSSVYSVALSPDGQFLASGNRDKTVRLWDTDTGEELRRLSGHTSFVNTVAFSPDGKFLASGSDDKTLRLWDPVTGRELHQLSGHTDSVNSVAFSPDGKFLASGNSDNTVRLWDAATARELCQLSGHTDSVNSVAFSPDGKFLASGSEDETVHLWDSATGKELSQLSGNTKTSMVSVAFSPDGKFLASGSYRISPGFRSNEKTVGLWDVATGRELRQLSGHTKSVNSVAFSPDGKFLASGSQDKTVGLWDMDTGRALHLLCGHTSYVKSVAFSPNGKVLASAGSDKTVRLWDVATGRELHQLSGHTGSVNSVAFSPDGKVLASGGSDETVRLWEAATGRELCQIGRYGFLVVSVAFSPDGKFLAFSRGDNTVRLWDPVMDRQLGKFQGHTRWIKNVAFSPDRKYLVSASHEGVVRLWDVADI